MGDRLRRRRPSFRSPKRRTGVPSSTGRFLMAREMHSSAAMQHSTLISGSQSWTGQPAFCVSSTKMW